MDLTGYCQLWIVTGLVSPHLLGEPRIIAVGDVEKLPIDFVHSHPEMTLGVLHGADFIEEFEDEVTIGFKFGLGAVRCSSH